MILVEYQDDQENHAAEGLEAIDFDNEDHREPGERHFDSNTREADEQPNREPPVDEKAMLIGELKATLRRIQEELMPKVKLHYSHYLKDFPAMTQMEKRHQLLEELTQLHLKDNQIVKAMSDEYLQADDESLAIYARDSEEILKRVMEYKTDIHKLRKDISARRTRIEKMHEANLMLKASLIDSLK